MIAHPKIDPVAFNLIGFDVHWYGMMYTFGFIIAWQIGRTMLKREGFALLRGLAVEDVIFAAAVGVIAGGRLGYVLFYNPLHYAANPVEAFFLWKGGMSFHGGLLGVIAAIWVMAKLHERRLRADYAAAVRIANEINEAIETMESKAAAEESAEAAAEESSEGIEASEMSEGEAEGEGEGEYESETPPPPPSLPENPRVFARLLDFAAVMTPPGLGLGRLGNFINGELPGRITSPDLPWAMTFGFPDDMPRHPSQLYQLAIEGFVLTALMLYLARHPRPAGWLAGSFLIGYALGRIGVEFFREPDSHLGLLFLQLSMGQLLSIPMLMLGVAMVYLSSKRSAP